MPIFTIVSKKWKRENCVMSVYIIHLAMEEINSVNTAALVLPSTLYTPGCQYLILIPTGRLQSLIFTKLADYKLRH